jgi:hypothetical protein
MSISREAACSSKHNTYRGHKQTPKGTIGRIVLTAAVYSGEGALDVGADDPARGWGIGGLGSGVARAWAGRGARSGWPTISRGLGRA